VERLGEDPRDRGLAHAAGAGEQEGVVDAATVQGIGQRAHHVLLPDQFGEAPWAPFTGEDEVGHRYLLGVRQGRWPRLFAPRGRFRGIVPWHPTPAAGASPRLLASPATARLCGPLAA